MKTPARNLLLAVMASLLTLGTAAWAQETPKSPPPSDTPPPAETAAPAQPAAQTPPAPPESTELRRLDVPDTDQSPPADSQAEASAEKSATPPSAEATEPSATPPAAATEATPNAPQEKKNRHRVNRHHGDGPGRVAIFHDAELGAGENVEAVISIVGSSTSAGTSQAVVSIGGSSTSKGDVGDAVVSVLGGSRVPSGHVGNAVVSILGNTYVNTRVGGAVVTVLGNVELGPDADIGGELVCVGGQVKRDPKAVVHGQVTNVVIGPHFTSFDWLHAWVTKCLLLGRPLAFGAHLMWAWLLALTFLAVYVLLAVLFPHGVEKCVTTFEERPGKSILTAFLVTLITPAAAILLAITIIGTPALIVGLLIAGVFGKVVMLAWFGRRFTRLLGEGKFTHPALAVLIGGIVVMLLYTIPIVGFVVSKLIAWLGLGAVVYTVIRGMKRSKPAAPAVVSGGSPAPMVVTPPAQAAAGIAAGAATAAAGDVGGSASVPVAPPALAPAVSAVTLMRAGFWIRLAASLIDVIVVAIAWAVFPNRLTPNFALIYAVYCIVLWALRGTTVGGIVCNLKVVRVDDRPMDWPTALVRALGGFISLVAAGFGFIWVAFDDQKQSWHDKIAGTTIVQVPRGVSLL